MESDIRKRLLLLLGEKIDRIGLKSSDLDDHFDLVKSGFVNSLEFVDLVTSLEKEFRCEIDFETAFEKEDLTTVGGLIRTMEENRHG